MGNILKKTPSRIYYESSIEDFVSIKYPADIVECLTESDEIQKKHILNSYCVFLTRARKGIVIYIPKANEYEDPYDVSKYYDSTYEYLKLCGIKDISEAIELFMKKAEYIGLIDQA